MIPVSSLSPKQKKALLSKSNNKRGINTSKVKVKPRKEFKPDPRQVDYHDEVWYDETA